MTKVTFTIIDDKTCIIKYNKLLSIGESIAKSNQMIYDILKNSNIKIYIEDTMTLIDINKKITDYQIDETSNIKILIKNYKSHVKDLSDEELNNPIIDFLTKNNTERACWYVGDLSVSVNVKKSFNNYGTEFIGYKSHMNCNVNDCDLVIYSLEDTYCLDSNCKLDSRFSIYEIKFIMLQNNYKFNKYITMPIICDKETIFEFFFKNFNKNFIKNIRCIDLELYCAIQEHKRSNIKKIIRQDIKKINIDDHFVLQYFCKNEKNIIDRMSYCDNKYVIMCRPVTSEQLNKILTIPINLLDIIYLYANFENNIPTSSDVFDQSFFIN